MGTVPQLLNKFGLFIGVNSVDINYQGTRTVAAKQYNVASLLKGIIPCELFFGILFKRPG
jgi:hypothetical protein